MASQNDGIDTPPTANRRMAKSMKPPLRCAVKAPRAMPATVASSMAPATSCSDSGRNVRMSPRTGRWVRSDVPQLPRTRSRM